jgi:hypothetical protein
MKIKELTITTEELNSAVHAYLRTQGITLPVKEVRKRYSFDEDWHVEFVDPDKKVVEPEPETEPETETVPNVIPAQD